MNISPADKTTLIVRMTLVVLALTLVVVGIIILGMMMFRDEPGNQNESPSGYLQPTVGEPAERTVVGTSGDTWMYTVDSEAEKKYVIKITKGLPDSRDELSISGRGCNGAGTGVTANLNKRFKDEDLLSKKIGKKTYYLTPIITTMMACSDERADWDEQLAEEIESIFQSLELEK